MATSLPRQFFSKHFRTPKRAKLIKRAVSPQVEELNVPLITIPEAQIKEYEMNMIPKGSFSFVLPQKLDITAKKFTIEYKLKIIKGSGNTIEVTKTFEDFVNFRRQLEINYGAIGKMALRRFPRFALTIRPRASKVENSRRFFIMYLQGLSQVKPSLGLLNDFIGIKESIPSATKSKVSNAKRNSAPPKAEVIKLSSFENIQMLGKGSFGKVFLVRFKQTGDLYAMKVLRIEEVRKNHQVEHTITERKVQMEAAHPFICALRFSFKDDTKLYMISDFCRGGELLTHMNKMGNFPENFVQFYAAEVALALEYLHTKSICYRDLKPENVLLDSDGHAKLTDFGLSKQNVSAFSLADTFCGTWDYIAPEQLVARAKKTNYGYSIDWWAFGCFVYHMFFGNPPFSHANANQQMGRILRAVFTFPPNVEISSEAKDFIKQLLNKNPVKRLGMTDGGFEALKNHKFFNQEAGGIDFEAMMRLELQSPLNLEISKDKLAEHFEPKDQEDALQWQAELEEEAALEDMENGSLADDEFADFQFNGSFILM